MGEFFVYLQNGNVNIIFFKIRKHGGIIGLIVLEYRKNKLIGILNEQ